MQLILETIPVIREEDKDELLRVMPCFVSSTWEVKRPLRKLLPEVNSEGSRFYRHTGGPIRTKQGLCLSSTGHVVSRPLDLGLLTTLKVSILVSP